MSNATQNLTEIMFNHTPKLAGEINATLYTCDKSCIGWYFEVGFILLALASVLVLMYFMGWLK